MIKLKYTYGANSEGGWTAWELCQCLVTGYVSSLQPESMSVVMHDWHTYAGLISALWIKIALWEPELSTITTWALQSHGAQCMLYAGGNVLQVGPPRCWHWGWKPVATPPLTAAGMHLAHKQPGQHCEGRDARKEDWVFWKAACDIQAHPSREGRAVTKLSTLASFVFIFVGQ